MGTDFSVSSVINSFFVVYSKTAVTNNCVFCGGSELQHGVKAATAQVEGSVLQSEPDIKP